MRGPRATPFTRTTHLRCALYDECAARVCLRVHVLLAVGVRSSARAPVLRLPSCSSLVCIMNADADTKGF